jgi:hypothetical protein
LAIRFLEDPVETNFGILIIPHMNALTNILQKNTDIFIDIDSSSREGHYRGCVRFSRLILNGQTVLAEVIFWDVIANQSGYLLVGSYVAQKIIHHILRLHYFPPLKLDIFVHPQARITPQRYS